MCEARKPRGRLPSKLMSKDTLTQDDNCVRFVADNGDKYEVDVGQMYQRNLGSGNRRAIRRKGCKWFFDSATVHKSYHGKIVFLKHAWCDDRSCEICNRRVPKAYPRDLQPLLETAFRGSVAFDKDVGTSVIHQSLCCSKGHAMISDQRWNHLCNICEGHGTAFRCIEKCDYDVCRDCSTAEQSIKSCMAMTPMNISVRADAETACKDILTNTTNSSAVLRRLQSLSEVRGFHFTAEHARLAALRIGSVAVLQVVLCSSPQVQLLGADIFDRRYPGIVLNGSVKSCIRILLTRGAQLGKFAPSSKLLHKVNSDGLHAWALRYFQSMILVGIDIPDHVQHEIIKFLP
mmetsp:Transcript_35761/g.56980  ORF Transcript_35761/g.56980 Transcript_35761/m.56980 type:complete len:346 (-) Transcript_35761:30-1067(-)